MHDRTYTKESSISNAGNGYRDLIAKIDLNSFRRIPWEHNVPFFLVWFLDSETKEPISPCPRSLLKSICDNIEDSVGAVATAGAEFEFFQYAETAKSISDKGYINLEPLTVGMFGYSLQRPSLVQDYYYDILKTCKDFDVELEGWHTETGPGVYEAAIAYSTAIKMADKASLFKYICKCLGPKYNAIPCFMAKPQQGLPGNSGHIHVSLMDKATGKNLFSREETDTGYKFKDAENLSDLGRHFLAGVLEGLPYVMPLFAPTVNSYKRLVENFWAPVTVSWGLEHRIASIRLIAEGPNSKSTRLEIRTPGADVHPHYAMSAIFALGLRGIEKKIELTVPPMSKNAADFGGFERLPRSLESAVEKFSSKDSLAREVLGDVFVDHFSITRLEEVSQWNDAVTNWEVQRYIETV